MVPIIKLIVDLEVRFGGSTAFGLIVSLASAAEMEACMGTGEAQAIARTKIHHWVYFEINVSTNDNGDFEGEVHYADTQNGMDQGLRRRTKVRRAAVALATVVSEELQKLVIDLA